MMVVLDLFMTVYQGILIIYVLKKQFSQKPHSFLWEISCVSLFVLLICLIQYSSLPIPDVLVFLIFLIYIKITTNERFLTCLFWVALDAFLLMSTLALVSSMFEIQIGINGDVIAASQETMIIYNFVGNAAITVVLSLAARINSVKKIIAQKEIILFLFMLILCFLISECFFTAKLLQDSSYPLLTGSVCTFIMLILTIVLYENMIESAKRQKQAEMSAQTMQLNTEHQNELESIYKQMLSVQHDLKHRIAAAEEILSVSTVHEEQRNQVLSLLKEEDLSSQVFLTGSIAADAILTAKTTIMKKEGITFCFTDYPLDPLPIPEQDFCVLLGNLLDNAIESVIKLPVSAPSRAIHLTFSKVFNMLFISCENDADLSTIRMRGDSFLTTKEHPELHGFGIENMRRIVDNAGGSIEFEIKDNHFSVEVILGGNTPC